MLNVISLKRNKKSKNLEMKEYDYVKQLHFAKFQPDILKNRTRDVKLTHR